MAKIRIGLVGANPEGNSWGARAHIPALKALPDYELKAICTAHNETAKRAAEAFGAELAFSDYHRMFDHPDIDLVSVAVRVPSHHAITMAALAAGKNVYCEWPLGANLREAEEMAHGARERGVRTMAGLQARSDPSLMYLRQLINDGYVGEVLTCHMTLFQPGALNRASGRIWTGDRANGANTLTIAGGHSIDALCFCLGEFTEISAKVATQIKQVRVGETGEMVGVNSPDNVVVNGVLENGSLASIHVASVPHHGSGGWRLEIYGTAGSIFASGAQANYSPEPIRLLGAKGGEPLTEIPVPGDCVLVPQGTPRGAPFNVAQAYARLAAGWHVDAKVNPDFELAARLHRLLAALERSSEEGKAVKLM